MPCPAARLPRWRRSPVDATEQRDLHRHRHEDQQLEVGKRGRVPEPLLVEHRVPGDRHSGAQREQEAQGVVVCGAAHEQRSGGDRPDPGHLPNARARGRDAYAVLVLGAPDMLGTALVFEWMGWWMWVPTGLPLLLFVPMFFRNGRLLSRRWWPLPVLGTTGAILVALAIALSPVPEAARVANPYAIDAPWLGPLLTAGIAAVMLAMGGAVVSLALRMRRGGAFERQQLKIFFFAALLWPAFGLFGAMTQFRWVPPGLSR